MAIVYSATHEGNQPKSLANDYAHVRIGDFLDPPLWETGILLLALVFGFLIFWTLDFLHGFANVAIPSALGAALALGNYDIARRHIVSLLTPMFIMRTAIIAYGAAGSLVSALSNDATQQIIEDFSAYTESELLKFNLVTLLFTVVFTRSGDIVRFVFEHSVSRSRKDIPQLGIAASNLSMIFVGLVFILTGSAVNYLIILPFQFGYVSTTFPVIVAQIGLASNIGLFLCLIWALRNQPKIAPILFVLGALFSAVGLTTFAKTDVILPILMMALAHIYVRPTIPKMAFWAVIVLAVFQASQPIVTHGRSAIALQYGDITAPVGLEERLEIISQYYNSGDSKIDEEVDYALVRLSYANVGTFVINEYDDGRPGESYGNIFAIFIPRFLWPSKPILSDISVELNVAISGSDTSAVATGLASEGYWNSGWLGVILAGFAAGTIIWLWSMYSITVQLAGAWHLFIIVLLGIRTGARFDGFFVSDILGSLVLAIAGHFAVSLLNQMLVKLRTPVTR